MNKWVWAVFASALFLGGCAQSYNRINEDSLQYGRNSNTEVVSYQYSSSVFSDSRNSWYQSKESQGRYQIIGFRFKNTSDKEFNFQSDATLVSGGHELEYFPTTKVTHQMIQPKGKFAWWLLLLPLNLTVTQNECDDFGCSPDVSFFPIGLILGPTVTLFKVVKASSADGNMKKDIDAHDCNKFTLSPGSTGHCFVSVSNIGTKRIELSGTQNSGGNSPGTQFRQFPNSNEAAPETSTQDESLDTSDFK
jgi:hypothetical protein